jgi:hypothetical protein
VTSSRSALEPTTPASPPPPGDAVKVGPVALAPALCVLVLVGAVVATLVAILPWWQGIGLAVAMSWFWLPGVLLWGRVYRGQRGWLWAAVLFGPATGYVLSSLALLGLWAAGWRSNGLLLVAPITAGLAAWPFGRLAGRLALPALGRRDLAAVCLVLLLVPAVVGRPYSRVGQDMPDGRAYRAYFTADFVWAVAVVAEVGKGEMPPRNVFYRGDSLRYYWLAHLFPAVESRAARRAVPIEKILLVNDFLVGLAFAGFLYVFVRHFVDRPWAASAACIGAVLFSSFEGAWYLVRLWRRGVPLSAIQTVNIDAVSRWFFQSMPVDGLHRVLMYQPQHEIGYALGLSALLLFVQARPRVTAGILFLAGSLLGMALLLSSFAALMLTVIAAVFGGFALLRQRAWGTIAGGAVAAALPMAGALLLSQVLHYVDSGSLVAFGPNQTATHNALPAIALSFGPMLIGALAGLAVALWKQTLRRFAVLLAGIAVCWLFYFLVDLPEHQHVYVGWRASHLLFVSFAALTAYGLQELWARGGVVRWSTAAVALVVALAAAPMVAIDVYNTQDTANRSMGPGFRWTVVLTPDELAAFDWIKRHTPQNALVQVEPAVRGRETWSYVPTFAERRMSAGLPISMIPMQKYEEASARITSLYRESDPARAHDRAVAACIDYLVVAPAERERYPTFQPLLDANPEYFAPAFRNGTVGIYAVTSLPASCGAPDPVR